MLARYVFILLLVLTAISADAQTKYVMVREGAPVYAERDSSSQIITTLEYGTAVLDTTEHRVQVFFKTYNTYFVSVETPLGNGFVPEVYLLPFPPPKNNVSTIDSYLMQISEPLGYIDSTYIPHPDGKDQTHIKRVYKDGFIVEDDIKWYERYHMLTLPNMRIQRAYVLMQYFYRDQNFFPDDYPIRDVKEQQLDKRTTRSIKITEDWDGNLNRLTIRVDDNVVLSELDFIQAGYHVIVVKSSAL